MKEQANRKIKLDEPVFIIGAPRSGNTLIGALLNKHPDFLIFFENNIFSHYYKRWRLVRNKDSESTDANFTSMLSEAFQSYHEKLSIKSEDVLEVVRKSRTGGDLDWRTAFNAYLSFLLPRAKPGAKYWGDKTPRHICSIHHILQVYPAARFIYTERNSTNAVTSLTKATFPYCYEDRLLNAYILKEHIRIYEKQKVRIPADQVLEVDYDQLVKDPKTGLEKICSFLEVAYTDEMLAETPDRLRQLIGWPDNKCWDPVKPQKSDIPPSEKNPLAEAYLSDRNKNPLFGAPFSPARIFYYILANLKLFPFIFLNWITSGSHQIRYHEPRILHLWPSFPKLYLWFKGSLPKRVWTKNELTRYIRKQKKQASQ